MKRFNLVYMEEMNDGTVSTGMGGTSETVVAIDSSNDVSSDIMSEEDALSYLSGSGQTEQQDQQAQAIQDDMQITSTDMGFDLDDIDMSMFGLEDVVNQEPQQVQQQQVDPNTLLMQQMMERIESLQNPQQQQPTDDELAPLKELAERMQQAGLLPKGLDKEHEELLQEVKTLRDEIKQQKEQQQQVQEFQSKINSIDAFSKELEQVIPNYNPELMINIVTQIANKDPRAGQQILNNPSMLITLWGKYGAKSQPKQQQTNVLSTNGNNNNIVSSQELFEKVKSGKGTEADELRLLSGL